MNHCPSIRFILATPLHKHMTELLDVIQSQQLLIEKFALLLYSDGGPDYHLTYLSV